MEQEVQELFSLWNDSLVTLDLTQVANRYSKNVLLLLTVSDKPRNTHAKIADYFDAYLQNQCVENRSSSFQCHARTITGRWCKINTSDQDYDRMNRIE